ncbi:disease resistance protein, partial [Trifolium medium]|nr:disease resistance protein [Trifolium medium]
MNKIPQVKEIPSGIKHLDNLKDIHFTDMPAEIAESINPDKGQYNWIIKH